MLAGVRRVSFERASLAFVGVSIAALYAIVLIDTLEPIAGREAPPVRVSLTAGVGAEPGADVVTVRDFEAALEKAGYRLADVWDDDRPVPRLFVRRIPDDLDKVQPLAKRKRLFIGTILPLVLYVNEAILMDRARLLNLRVRLDGGTVRLSAAERAWLRSLRQRYGVVDGLLDELVRRVDVVPPSLAVAQAAAESGWGTSRFARRGNAIFGELTFAPGAGMVPLRRDRGENHEVLRFPALLGSVAAYMMNLNRHPAYREFRLARETLRTSKGMLDGYELAATLTHYSAKRRAYVRTIRAIIRINDLKGLDRARLEGGAAISAGPPEA